MTSASRVLDVLPLFHDDLRLQLLVTSTGSSPFQSGIQELFSAMGLPVLPWKEAIAAPIDLAISASFGGELHNISPCYDRMLAGRPYRQRFRRALGVRRGQRLLVLNSTWNTEGFFGNGGSRDLLPSILPRLGTELPVDEYRIAAVLHPNIWHGHGPGQIRAWLDRAQRNGLVLIDPLHGWRQALLAADIVLGDFGAVSYYAAALGIPVLLAAADQERLDPETPLAEFVRSAPQLDAHAPLRDQLDRTFAEHRALPDPARFVSSAPGESAALLRHNFYALLGIPEPPAPTLLEPLPLPPYEPPRRTTPMRARTSVRGRRVHVERSTVHPYTADGETHLAVHEDTRDPGEPAAADVIVREGPPDDPRLGSPATWATEVMDQYPYCALARLGSRRTCRLAIQLLDDGSAASEVTRRGRHSRARTQRTRRTSASQQQSPLEVPTLIGRDQRAHLTAQFRPADCIHAA
ncbi:hypothetical protein ACFWN1_14835 [Streptomyces sp. NPDC058459]|uniref:hypothetical protein n=1 Tax=Streptomyces sp. NPDC058459 TaxID=3346508 RepID=UPI003669C035